MVKRITAVLSLFVLLSCGWAAERAAEFDSDRYLQHVRFLASEDMKGRGTGRPELDKAAEYIAGQFRQASLQPADGRSFYQDFTVTTKARIGANNRLVVRDAGAERALKFQTEFIPFNFSARGSYSGQVAFVGYGITANEYGYDEYAGVDVKGKFVLVLRHEPQEYDEKSIFAGKVYTEHAQLFSKAVNAKMHGALGVLFINDTGNHGGREGDLEKFESTVGPTDAGIPFVQVKAEIAEEWLAQAGRKLADIQKGIDEDLKPRSFALPETLTVQLQTDLRRDLRTVRNVVGYLPGREPEYIVIGAHYDHLGLGEQFSMAPSEAGKPHPGADDNASGTAAVIELARYYAAQPQRKRGLLFMTFAGEELGLLGSSHYVNNPLMPLGKAVAMINMDMIGRIRDSKVYVGGVGTGTTFREVLDSMLDRTELKIEYSDLTGYGSSDHTSFTTKEVPVLFFFSGLHSDYHRPSDTWDKIDAPQTAKLLGFIAGVADKLAGEEERPQFVRVVDPHGGKMGAIAGSSAGGYGPYFGSVPDFADNPKGLRFADVREGSPAAKAGLKAGDILTEFDGKPIQNLYDFTYALRAKKPGDEAPVKVLRTDSVVEATVTLEERK
ncbi:MAG: M28 family peptidase [Bryobacteraceae bacterium]|nr:M28 family peptidase [Bryobacteraceae bacterium]